MFGCWVIWHCHIMEIQGMWILATGLNFDPRNHTQLDHWYFDTQKYLGDVWTI